MPMPSSEKWGGKPVNPVNIPLKRDFYFLLFSSSYFYLKIFNMIYALNAKYSKESAVKSL